ncbi:MAG: adenylate/guanylate cyclase domain-containing protein [Chloroflexi bacterium]|nr:MAG: adenylate/guanylate cyclase domain-containing protein [Chloroflexota bacterium]
MEASERAGALLDNGLPSGTVTFLFTDIEGSTRRWETDEAAMWADVRLHNEVLHGAIRANHGHPFKMIGDAVQAAFADPNDALRAVITAQRNLARQTWTGGSVLRVRMALHTGEAEPRDGDYLAPCLNRLARLMSAGFGGQVLLSSVTAELVRATLPEGISLRDLGRHRLKDLNQPEQIFQVVGPGLLDDFPALKTLDSRPHNLPLQPTSLIGRDDDVALVRELLTRADSRVVTLTGPGGAGKTRLGLQVGADALDDYSDGVYFVPLAAVRDPKLVLSAIATALRVQETGGTPVGQLLAEALHDKQLLLILDNLEQVVEAAAEIGDLLRHCTRCKVLATSRIRLGLYGEREYPVPPLDLPDPNALPALDVLAENQSVRLFVDRAEAVKPGFTLDAGNAQAIANICVRLDGLPLAIELAAARIRLLTPRAMLDRMEKRLPLLTGGARDMPARHQTLRNTIAWSFELLTPDEQRLYRRLAIFAGGWTFDAAEAVVDVASFDDPVAGVLDGLSALVDHNLVRQAEQPDGMPRFDMFQTIREFGLEQLQQAGELESVARRHAEYYAGLAEGFEPVVFGPEQVAWLDRLDVELDNLRAAMTWAGAAGQSELLLQLAGALRRYWEIRGHLSEGQHWLRTALAAHSGLSAWRARALDASGNLAVFQGELEIATRQYQESLTISEQLGDDNATAETTHNLATVAMYRGDFEQAIARYTASLEAFRALGNRRWEANVLGSLGVAYGASGILDRAEELLRASLALQRALNHPYGVALALGNLATVAAEHGDYAGAIRLLRECLQVERDLGSATGMVDSIGGLADLLALIGEHHTAAILYGFEDAQREAMHMPTSSLNRELRERSLDIVRNALSHEEFVRQTQTGQGLNLAGAVALAMDEAD